MTLSAPVIETERMILRGPEASDFEAYAAFMESDRSHMTGGPMDRATAWRAFACEIGHWVLHGFGMWTATDRETGAIVGQAGFWMPEGWLERELGWRLYEGFEGRGLAIEAALALRGHAYERLGWGPLISVIAPGNARSIRLAERLGATLERDDWTTPSGKAALIYRHPGVNAMQEVSA